MPTSRSDILPPVLAKDVRLDMQRFLLGHGTGADPARLTEACVAQMGKVPETANLGFVYATDALANDLEGIVEKLKLETGVQHWTGTVGVGINATGQEYYDEPALAVMIAEVQEAAFRTMPPQHASDDGFAPELRDWLDQDAFHFGILHADPASPSTPPLINELAERVPGGFFVGGLSSSHGRNAQVADGISDSGISGVLFNSDVAVVTGHTQGCTPIADKHRVTACERNLLIELDGRPALDVLREDVGEVIARDLQRIAGYIFAAIPIAGSDTGDYMVRNLLGVDTDQGLVAIGDLVEAGQEIMFCRRDGNSAREDMQRMLDDIDARLGENARGAVYYSCLGRGRHQFGGNSEELQIIRERLGDIPLVGFFANGEIFHNRLYGYTGVLTVFG